MSDTDSQRGAGGVDVSIVIVSWNTRSILRDCLASVYKETKGISFEVILVDNASSDDSVAMVQKEFPQVTLIQNTENAGFVVANNQAFRIARGRYVLLLNSDTVVLDNAIQKTMEHADARPKGAVFGCKVLFPDGRLQRACFMYPSPLNLLIQALYLNSIFPKNKLCGRERMTWWEFDDARQVETIAGCFSLVRKSAIAEVGSMDPIYFFYGDDPDWCWRFKKAGWEIHFFPDASIIHLGGQSSKKLRRAFRLQLNGSQLTFIRLNRSFASFLAACFCSSLFFALRVPFWLAKAAISPMDRKGNLENAGTYVIGAFYSIFDWKSLLMNRKELAQRLQHPKAAFPD